MVSRRELTNLGCEDRYKLTDESATRIMRLGNFVSETVNAVSSALDFVGHCRAPNVVRSSVRHTPPELGVIDKNLRFEWSEEMLQVLTGLVNAIDSLAVIQRHTATPIRVPNFDTLPPGQAQTWGFAANLLNGEDVTRTYPEGHCLIVELATDIAVPEEKLGIVLPLTVDIGEQTIDLGQVEAWLTNPTLITRRTHEGRTLHVFTTPDRHVRYHRPQ